MTHDPEDDLPQYLCTSIAVPFDGSASDDSGVPAYQHVPAPELLLRYPDAINICAPMVRYSKHAFRALVSQYNVQISTTPMILAQEFSRSAIARDADFSTSPYERGYFSFTKGRSAKLDRGVHGSRPELVRGSLICQMAANNGAQLADAAELVAPFVDGIDLNCGCPQPWAYSEGIGSALLRQPDKVRDMVRAVKGRLGEGFCMSVKIRVDSDLKLTDQLVRTALHAGASILSIHGRTRHQASESHPVNLDTIRFAVDAARSCGNQTACASGSTASLASVEGSQSVDGAKAGQAAGTDDSEPSLPGRTEWNFDGGGAGGAVPCVANGDVWSLLEAREWRRRTTAEGIMSARGLLANPALFSGYKHTPHEAVREFVALSLAWGLPYPLFQRHIAYMLEGQVQRQEAIHFNALGSAAAVIDWLTENEIFPPDHGPLTFDSTVAAKRLRSAII
ncbi:FMN-linked oxidoreductase [Tilletiaria anomala UBC 951]|uniref:FMN-linked oxidoreductase n=1 Tax=Tilletiaria anomala (strain ATCC 24038 / CBS 436.72 / UBC 951) TaxID=1037660 RepID=A0A066WAU8_TILAU|nr:FMN-linked oxidoreductase [Tilletiaria anomala UBC 951]KDN48214.1 FMN-linked oxidoreductase [Tilletiaria anomala UBC 951]